VTGVNEVSSQVMFIEFVKVEIALVVTDPMGKHVVDGY
jgi:hypothetical protein